LFQQNIDDVIAECMDMFKCLPVADAILNVKEFFVTVQSM